METQVLMMPSSRKGRGKKKVMRRPVPIPLALALRLRDAGAARVTTELLLQRKARNGKDGFGRGPWNKSDHSRRFKRVVQAIGLSPAEVTIYALRHSSVVRQLLGNVPARVVAVNHDTSIAMLERTYSRHIGDHADALARVTLLDAGPGSATNVVALRMTGGSAA